MPYDPQQFWTDFMDKKMKRRCFSAPLRKYKRLCYSESPVSSCASNDPWGNKEIDLEKMSSELNLRKIEPEKTKSPAFYDIMSNFEGFQLDVIKDLVSKEEEERSKERTKPRGISFKKKGKIRKRASDSEDEKLRNYKKCCLDVQMHNEFLSQEDMLVAFDIFRDRKTCVAYLACESVDLKVGFVKRLIAEQACPDFVPQSPL